MSAPTREDASDNEEGIMVAIRMRPLNSKESQTKSKRVWRVLSRHNSVAQCTPEGKPLPERINNRNFFTYDKTFGETCTTRTVYDDVAKGIVGSVTNGLNGTIFAYGQTSSGKTFTMQGNGSVEPSNLNTDGGIVHMAASDVFSHIESNTDRVFLVRVSFIEIYNEEVRDLLVSGGDDNTLSVREDPRRGVFVNSNETIVTGLDSLLSVLFAGEKNRSMASTGMNERSSRSHTIFRITVESRSKNVDAEEENRSSSDEDMEDMDDNEMDNGNGAVRVSTLNLVDLAGSESVRHTGATGDRQKEGGKINQSLLTLSRVIGSLGQNATHINFRDSKLTRILQPSLSGNARMAVICCATPSELYLEETRSTLQFASRAKLVKTRAQVNEVIDDRSLIKKLQRELKEARDAGNGHVAMEQMKALEEKAVNEAEAKRKAEHDLKRMKDLILKGGVLPMNISFNGAGKSSLFKSLFVYNDSNKTTKSDSKIFFYNTGQKGKGKRRYSDGVIKCPSPICDITKHEPNSASFGSPSGDVITQVQAKTEIKPKKIKTNTQISTSALTEEDDIDLLRKALASKSAQAKDLKSKLIQVTEQAQSTEQMLKTEQGEKEMLRLVKQDLEQHVTALVSDKEFVMTEQDIICTEKDSEISNYLTKIETMRSEEKAQAESVSLLNAMVETLQSQIETMKKEHAVEVETMDQMRNNELADVQSEMTLLRNQMESMQSDLEKSSNNIDTLNTQVEELTSKNTELTLEKKSLQIELDEKNVVLQQTSEKLQEAVETTVTLEESVEEIKCSARESEMKKEEIEAQLGAVIVEKNSLAKELDQAVKRLENEIESSTNKMNDLVSKNEASDAKTTDLILTFEAKDKEISNLRSQKDLLESTTVELQQQVQELNQTVEELRAQIIMLETSAKESAETERNLKELEQEVAEKGNLIDTLNSQLSELESIRAEKETLSADLESATAKLSTLENESSIQLSKLKEMVADIDTLRSERDDAEARTRELLEGDNEAMDIVNSLQSEKTALVERVEETITRLDKEKEDLTSSIIELQQSNNKLTDELSSAKSEINDLLMMAEKSKADYESLLKEREECLQELESTIDQNQELANKLNEADNRQNEQITRPQQEASLFPTDSSETSDSTKKEIDELRTLLSSANQSVVEARTAALDADQELKDKEMQLEQALKHLSEANKKLKSLESLPSSEHLHSESEEELLNEIKRLMNEKVEAESRLEAELGKRKEVEDEIMRAADEEKQIVIVEAEEKMVLLRDEISHLKSDLCRVEEELYTIKDENRELQEQFERAETKARDTEVKAAAIGRDLDQEMQSKMDLQQRFDELQEENTTFRSQVFAAKESMETEAKKSLQVVEEKLSEALISLSASQKEVKELNKTIEDLTGDIEEYKQQLSSIRHLETTENDIEAYRLREELAQAKVELATLKTDYLSAKSEVTAAKEKISQVKAREHEKCLALAQKAKDSIEQLQQRVRKAEEKVEQGEGSSENVALFKNQLDDLNSTIREKDARIKKLEKTKMTKEQVEKIRKMQEERIKYMAEAKEFKQRVEELEQEMENTANSKPRRKGLRERTDDDNEDLVRLRDQLNQCNSKLRKYVEHSERLEKERNGAMTILSSCNIEDIMGSCLEEMVKSLCERLTSIEEECDALANSEDKAAGYLADLDSLREKCTECENQLQFYKETNAELSSVHQDCKENLKRAHEKIASLTKELKSLQESHTNTKGSMSELQDEQRRQLQWLEKENLQLGDELKRTKKELLQTKSRLNTTQKGSVDSDEATEDLVGLSKFFEDSSARKPLGSIAKSATGSSVNTSEKKRQLSANEALDKENDTNSSDHIHTIKSPFPSSAKKQRKSINPFSSVKKASRKIIQSRSDSSPPETKHMRLGEEGEHTSELTSDCKQS